MKSETNKFTFVFILAALFSLFHNILVIYIPIYLKDIGLNGFEIGLLFSLYSLAAFISLFQAGILSDRLSSRTMIIISILLLAVFYIGLSFGLTVIWILIVLFLIFGLGHNIMKVATDSFTLKNVEENKGRLFGKYELIRTTSGAAGFLIGGFLLTILPFTTNLRLVGLASLLTLWMAVFIPKTKTHKESVRKYLGDFKDWKVLVFSTFVFLFTLHWGVESVAYGLLLKERLLLDYTSMGIFIAIPIVFLAVSAYYFGVRYDKKMSGKTMLTTAFLLSGIGFVALGLTTNVGWALVGRIIHEIGDGAFAIFILVGASRYFKKNRLGGDLGLILVVTIISRFIGSLVFSPVGESFGYHVPHIISGMIMVGVAIAFFVFHNLHVKKTSS